MKILNKIAHYTPTRQTNTENYNILPHLAEKITSNERNLDENNTQTKETNAQMYAKLPHIVENYMKQTKPVRNCIHSQNEITFKVLFNIVIQFFIVYFYLRRWLFSRVHCDV